VERLDRLFSIFSAMASAAEGLSRAIYVMISLKSSSAACNNRIVYLTVAKIMDKKGA